MSLCSFRQVELYLATSLPMSPLVSIPNCCFPPNPPSSIIFSYLVILILPCLNLFPSSFSFAFRPLYPNRNTDHPHLYSSTTAASPACTVKVCPTTLLRPSHPPSHLPTSSPLLSTPYLHFPPTQHPLPLPSTNLPPPPQQAQPTTQSKAASAS